MMLALLVVLQTGSVCVTSTNVCAPAGSTVSGQVGQMGGQVTITPSKPMKALGAEFQAGKAVTVTVNPWGGSTRGAIVHVGGELTKDTTVTGVRVAGQVRIGQIQGPLTGLPGEPQLEEATDIKGGAYQVGKAGTVDVGPGTKIIGYVDISGVRLDITSDKPIRALGLELTAGTVRIERRADSVTIGGKLAKPQSVGGVLVDKEIYATLGGKTPVFGNATLARATSLRTLGLPDGEAPAGTIVRSTPATTLLFDTAPIKICGIALVHGAMQQPPALNVATNGKELTINGMLAARDTDVGNGLRMSGPITLRYTAGTCDRRGIDGTLARPTVQRGLRFKAGKQYVDGVGPSGETYIKGTLEAPVTVDGLKLTGELMVSAPNATDLHLMDGTLAKAATFEAWKLPARSFVQRFGAGWTFRVPKGQAATAVADYLGERITAVTDAYSDANHTSFTLRKPHTPKGTKLALASVGIDKLTGCVMGNVGTAQQLGIFKIPKNGAATLCGGTLSRAEGTYAVPDLQVGTWWATTAVGGAANAPPQEAQPRDDLDMGRVHKTPAPKAPTSSNAPPPTTAQNASKIVTGYWIQINSLCQAPAGIPLPPPPQRWIWVDLKGNASTTADTQELTTKASKRGTPCPKYPCCPP